MKRIYIIMGELEDTDIIDCYDSAQPTMERAEQRCIELAIEQPNHIWYWREIIFEE